MAGNHHNMTSGHLKYNYSLICLQNLQNSEYSKNNIFLHVRGHRKLVLLIFLNVILTAGTHHNMKSGHLQCNNSLIWLQNLPKSEKSKNDIFLQVHCH